MFTNVKQAAFSLACRVAPCDVRDTIVVAGLQRSGTTWLAELLREIPGYKYVNEPLNNGDVVAPRVCLRPGERHTKVEQYLARVFAGQVRHSWLYRFKSDSRALQLMEQASQRKLIAKFVGANRMLQWMLDRFPISRAVVIVRHPCAVIASMLEMQWFQKAFLRESRGKSLVEQATAGAAPEAVQERFADTLDGLATHTEVLAVWWCLSYYILFHEHVRGTTKYPWVLANYERLVTRREDEFERIAASFGYEMPRSVRRRFDVGSLSASSSLSTDRIQQQLSKWKRKLTTEQIDDILGIVETFGLDFYTDALHPDYDRLMQFQRDDTKVSTHA